jgi:hypothetical protein
MNNPIEDFVQEYGDVKLATGTPSFGRQMLRGAGVGAGTAAIAGGIGAVGMAASKIYDAATKARDFKHMMEYNADLQEHHDRDPRMFNQMYSSLRAMNPTFSKDPIVAGTYMRQMVDSPSSAGGVLVNTVASRDKFPSTMGRALEEGQSAAKGSFIGSMKSPR